MTDFQEKERKKIREAQKLYSKAGWMADFKGAGQFLIALGLVFIIPALLASLHPDVIWSKVTSFLWTGGILLFCGLLLYRPFKKKEDKYRKAADMVRRGMETETALYQTADVFQENMALEVQEKQYFEENKDDFADFYKEVRKILVETYHFRADKVSQASQDSYIMAGYATLQGKTPEQVAFQIYNYFYMNGELKNPDIFAEGDWESYTQEKHRWKKRTRIVLLILAWFLLSLFYGLFFTDGYVPTEIWRNTYIFVAVFLSAALYLWIAYGYLSGKIPQQKAQTDLIEKIFRLFVLLISVVMLHLSLTVAIGHTPGSLMTQFTKVEAMSQSYLFQKTKNGQSAFHYCFDKGEVYGRKQRLADLYCTLQTDYPDTPQSLSMLCQVKTSWFGTVISDCRVDKSKEG